MRLPDLLDHRLYRTIQRFQAFDTFFGIQDLVLVKQQNTLKYWVDRWCPRCSTSLLLLIHLSEPVYCPCERSCCPTPPPRFPGTACFTSLCIFDVPLCTIDTPLCMFNFTPLCSPRFPVNTARSGGLLVDGAYFEPLCTFDGPLWTTYSSRCTLDVHSTSSLQGVTDVLQHLVLFLSDVGHCSFGQETRAPGACYCLSSR